MRSTRYHTLVRDKIPDIIRAGGGVPQLRVLDDDEYLAELKKKIIQSAWDVFYSEPQNLKEHFAELLEISTWMMKGVDVDPQDVFAVVEQRREARGGFAEKYYLVSVEEESEKE
jgi:predicted house-cleaning noncanonical NTP pyrophosphatase (MazG superfamily)